MTYEKTTHIHTDEAWLAKLSEEILDPDLPIIDPHHHLWDRLGPYYADELLADLTSGHNIRKSIFVQCRYGYRADGPEEMRPVGETEFAVGVAEDAAEKNPDIVACAGIVAHANLMLGDGVQPVLDAHRQAAKGRLRGIRHYTASGGDAFSGAVPNSPLRMMYDDAFRAGFAKLAENGLSYDGWLYHPQIPDFTDLARAFPETTMILDHFGGPLGIGPYRGKGDEVFAEWKRHMTDLATCPNAHVKMGGLAMDVNGFDLHLEPLPPSSGECARLWRPYVETTIELFGADRCMFESNFPVDKGAVSYPVVWNTFKRITAGASDDEKAKLFHDTAAKVYRL
ncbi:amidohydrolase family protein [Pseudooceanicola onchidii]|uniref:amidohydrolase family protein n=1 Tax=Pseudooceanicola onchidii TaxID=2562279 RepID=UPI0010AB47BC|nr:amidohydrolase family protein [Pseudooceanicola onchidii]